MQILADLFFDLKYKPFQRQANHTKKNKYNDFIKKFFYYI